MISWFWFFSVLVALIAGFAISVYVNRKTDTEQKLKQEQLQVKILIAIQKKLAGLLKEGEEVNLSP